MVYEVKFNHIDNRYKVLDQHGYCFGDGRTIDEAVQSARIVTAKPIKYFNGEYTENL